MKKYISFWALFLAGMLLTVTSCSEDLHQPVDLDRDSDGMLVVNANLIVEGMTEVATRGLEDISGKDLIVKALEFSWSDDNETSFLTNVYDVEVTSASTAAPNMTELGLKLKLYATTDPTRLQFIVTETDPGQIPYGSMVTILQSLSVSNGAEAYWGEVTFPTGYGTLEYNEKTEEMDFKKDPDLEDDLKKIPVIRNFAKISVQADLNNFDLEGFELVNIPTAGTIAPWDPATKKPAELLDGTTMKAYDKLPEGYTGMLSPSAQFDNTEADIRDGVATLSFTTDERYIYEHPFENYRRTYLLIKGKFGGSETSTYYKVDLGSTDATTQEFTNFNIIRNYHYVVTINSVERAGYATVEAALNGVVFNNLSASTETRDILQLSDGSDLIGVNLTKAVIVDNTNPIVFKYSYRTGLTDTSKGEVDNYKVTVYGLEKGPVIDRVEGPVEDGDSIVYTIYPKDPPTLLQPTEQKFTVVGRNGLGRTITLISHVRWDYSNVQIYGVNANARPDSDTDLGKVGANQGDPLTLFFNLPDGLPESIFPLQFIIEADRQNIENNSQEGSTLSVRTAQSLFTGVNDPRVSYVKTVTYEQYEYLPDENNQVSAEVKNSNHTVRCRFRTTVSLSELPGNPTSMETKVIIHNPYFNNTDTSFTRTQ
ncbi:MAG: hypothetical protein K2N48_12365 [Muribaculaceae bacterium]|nr:hypothetical protein [Muribaculaceae bacterium]